MHRVLPMLFALSALPSQAAELQPFSASYIAEMERTPIGGTAGRSLQATGNGRWELVVKAAIPVASLSAVSTFRGENGIVLPLTYRFKRSALGRSREIEYDFDWTAGRVVGSNRGDPVSVPLQRGMQDKSTYQVVLQQDVAAGKQNMSYQVIDGDGVKAYAFRVVGEERVRTSAGSIDTIKVERVRDTAQSSRKTVLWFAKDWDYLLVGLHQLEKDGKEYRILLKDGSVNGRSVKGIKE